VPTSVSACRTQAAGAARTFRAPSSIVPVTRCVPRLASITRAGKGEGGPGGQPERGLPAVRAPRGTRPANTQPRRPSFTADRHRTPSPSTCRLRTQGGRGRGVADRRVADGRLVGTQVLGHVRDTVLPRRIRRQVSTVKVPTESEIKHDRSGGRAEVKSSADPTSTKGGRGRARRASRRGTLPRRSLGDGLGPPSARRIRAGVDGYVHTAPPPRPDST
jgi:hypothetical protein